MKSVTTLIFYEAAVQCTVASSQNMAIYKREDLNIQGGQYYVLLPPQDEMCLRVQCSRWSINPTDRHSEPISEI